MQYNLLTKLIGPTSNNTLTGPAARFVLAATLLIYFWQSATTKLAGLFTPSDGAYAQIFPRAFEAAGYDSSQFGHGIGPLPWQEAMPNISCLLSLSLAFSHASQRLE